MASSVFKYSYCRSIVYTACVVLSVDCTRRGSQAAVRDVLKPPPTPNEHLPAGAENPWTTWKALNRLRTQVGRSRVNMLKWGFSNEPETCDCGIKQTMQHLLVCPMMNTVCSPQDLTTANDIAIGCARHWEGTI